MGVVRLGGVLEDDKGELGSESPFDHRNSLLPCALRIKGTTKLLIQNFLTKSANMASFPGRVSCSVNTAVLLTV